MQRPKLTTTVWEDEGTVCYQVDAKSVCVARRQDNDMINGTKLLNVVGMSRGKRDGILKNEKGRIVVKVGAMHLKGVWITFERAKDLAAKFKITDLLYPLFTDDPSVFLCPSTVPGTNVSVASSAIFPPPSGITSTISQPNLSMMVPSRTMTPSFPYKQDPAYGFPISSWERHTDSSNDSIDHHDSFTSKFVTYILFKNIDLCFFFFRHSSWK
ncbi:transcription regulator HTH, apses-type DNA-binding domain-containing protein [Halteromyces radiatus]|uniref:transcription regulator HTH, apses-type DNA-binding domain-containing protein n=1 Tax=Halteromyces radiatus TaxID=101107 RepID=UPI002220578B|nr:transcription regulator HTH, apses-type DNA-binding domain-containing protein [Halteromyces radiatus]KAI8084659.1 transcription regulator HTH, apses-type DNA-binding domain-containing protein [Halteromyces radiatus]